VKMNIKAFLVFCCFALANLAQAQQASALQLYAQAATFLRQQYFGPSTINLETQITLGEIALRYECSKRTTSDCPFEVAESHLRRLFAALEDGHTYYLTAEQVKTEQANRSGQAQTPRPALGLRFAIFCQTPTGECATDENDQRTSSLERDQLIRVVVQNSPAEAAGVLAGDRLIGFNNTLFSSLPTEAAYLEFRATLTPKVQAGERIPLNLLRGVDRTRVDISLTGAIYNASERPRLELRSDGIAIITMRDYQVSGVGQEVHNLLRQAEQRGARAVVFDQRGNGGGSVYEMLLTVGAFLPNLHVFQFVPRYNATTNTLSFGYNQSGAFVRQGVGEWQLQLRVTNPISSRLPLVVLVDEDCASGCEYLSTYMQRQKRGTGIGTRTAGVGNSNTARFALVNGGAAGIPTLRAFWLDGTSLPATVQPDVLLDNNRYGWFQTGRDVVLERALATLGS
jgi:carboxyl-terminal processing protease